MAELNKTLVYDNDGSYKGSFGIKPLDYWIKKGMKDGYQFMYKGYHYSYGDKSQVVVFSNEPWDNQEIARRKGNGFLGIREYILY